MTAYILLGWFYVWGLALAVCLFDDIWKQRFTKAAPKLTVALYLSLVFGWPVLVPVMIFGVATARARARALARRSGA